MLTIDFGAETVANELPLEQTLAAIYDHNRQFASHIRHYASAQYVSDLSYRVARLEHVPTEEYILNQDGSYTLHFIQQLQLKPGLFAYFLIPQDETQRKEIKLVFRGTNFQDSYSALINLEYGGPGTTSFNLEKDNIFEQLQEVLTQYYSAEQRLTLQVYGHSQGAAMAQLFATQFLIEFLHTSHFENIKALNMTALNAPGIPPEIAARSRDYATHLLGARNKPPLAINAYYGMVHGDPVQISGLDSAFLGISHDIAGVHLFLVDTGLKGNWLKDMYLPDGIQVYELFQMVGNAISHLGAHSDWNFFAPQQNTDGKIVVTNPHMHHLYSNRNPEDIAIMKAELGNKFETVCKSFYFIHEAYQNLDIDYLVTPLIHNVIYPTGKKLLNMASYFSASEEQKDKKEHKIAARYDK